MASNLPNEQKTNWVSNQIVMPADTNAWGEAINTLSKAVPLYSACGNFYTATYTNNVYNLTPLSFTDTTSNVTVDSYVDGMTIQFQCPTNNLANCSVNVNSLGTKIIKDFDNTNLPANRLKQGILISMTYDKTNNCFKLSSSSNADKLTTGAKINGVNFKGDTDIVTGAGFYYNTVTYSEGNLAFIYNQDGALELYKSLVNNNIGNNPLTSTSYWEKQNLGSGRNIGEIVTSTIPLTDAGLHLLDGSLISGSGVYADFYDYMDELETTYGHNPNFFCSEADWQTSVSTYGVCGKFVIDRTNQTIRLPKLTGILEGTVDVNVLGSLVQAGLPNMTTVSAGEHTHKITSSGGHSHTITVRGGSNSVDYNQNYNQICNTNTYKGTYTNVATIASNTGTHTHSPQNAGEHTHTVTWGANVDTVQPQTIKVLYYIVIANSTKTQIEVDIDEIATDLNGKADTDLSNLTATSSTNFDGQWVKSKLEIFTQKYWNVGNTQETYDLSSYLPNDGYAYEVLLSADFRVIDIF